MSNIWIPAISRVHPPFVRPSGQPSVRPSCVEKPFTLDITNNIFNPFLFMPTMIIGTIDFYHFTPFSAASTSDGGQKVSGNNPVGFIFPAHFSTDQDTI